MLTEFSPGNWLGVSQSTCRGAGVGAFITELAPYLTPHTLALSKSLTRKYSTSYTIIKFKNTTHVAKVLVSERWLH